MKPQQGLNLDARGSGIQIRDAAPDLECATGTEIEMLNAMTRRSLAFDLAGLIEYKDPPSNLWRLVSLRSASFNCYARAACASAECVNSANEGSSQPVEACARLMPSLPA